MTWVSHCRLEYEANPVLIFLDRLSFSRHKVAEQIILVAVQMIKFSRTFLGVIACSFVMIPIYLGLWLYEIGGTNGMMNDDSYPMSIFLTPLIAALVSACVFWIIVYPWAQMTRWIANRNGMTLSNGCAVAVYVPTIIGAFLGVLSGGIYSALAAGSYLGLASWVFWRTAARKEVSKPLDAIGGNVLL
jgi:hypothetical protein